MVEDEPMEDVVTVASGGRVGDRRTKLRDQNLLEYFELVYHRLQCLSFDTIEVMNILF